MNSIKNYGFYKNPISYGTRYEVGSMNLPRQCRGFTLIEILIVIAVLGMVTIIGITTLPAFEKTVELNSYTTEIISSLSQARAQTLSSKGGLQYSIHFEISRFVLFEGVVFNDSDPNNIEVLSPNSVEIGSHTFEGGGDDVTFKKITGETNNYGVIIVRLISNVTKTKTITIEKTGVIGYE